MASLTQLCVQLQSVAGIKDRDLSKLGAEIMEAYSKLPAMGFVTEVVKARKAYEATTAKTKEREAATELLNITLRNLAEASASHPSVKAGVKQAEQAVKNAVALGLVKNVETK